MNTPGGNTISTAEHTMALMLAMSRNVAPAYQSLIEGRWDRKKFMGTQLAGKTLGIIGLGRVGQAVATRAHGLEMLVLGYDPFLSGRGPRSWASKPAKRPQDMLPLVDYLTVHTPLNDSTRNLIGAKEVQMLKKGVRLINCARGGIYDEAALAEGLKSGQIGGVALDVYPREPCTKSPLFGLPGVLCTPHLGASTEEAQTSVAVEAAELLIDFFTTGAIKQSVNMSPLDPKTLEELRGYLNVAYRLGLLLAQMDHCPPDQLPAELQGRGGQERHAALVFGLCRRALGTRLGGRSEHRQRRSPLARSRHRGDRATQHRNRRFQLGDHRRGGHRRKTSIAAGTLFGNNMPRLVQKGNCRLESYLDGVLMIFAHRDRPGVIGKVGSIFGRHRINIAQMSVGRSADKPGGDAIGMLALDSAPPAEALAEVTAMDDVSQAWIVKAAARRRVAPVMAAGWLDQIPPNSHSVILVAGGPRSNYIQNDKRLEFSWFTRIWRGIPSAQTVS